MILAGKRGEMVFEYTPDEVGIAESFFRFKIEGTSVDEVFLFTGSVVEPVVAFVPSNYGKIKKNTTNIAKIRQNYGKNMAKYGKIWQKYGKILQNYGKIRIKHSTT